MEPGFDRPSTSTCDNPMCTCDPCTCDDCHCGVARLGDLERRVMDRLWEGPERELTGRAVADVFPEHAYTTVATVLDRLVHKGLLHRRMDGRSIKFAVVGTRGAHTAALMHEDLVASHDPDAALVWFSQTLSPSEAAILRQALTERAARSVPSDE